MYTWNVHTRYKYVYAQMAGDHLHKWINDCENDDHDNAVDDEISHWRMYIYLYIIIPSDALYCFAFLYFISTVIHLRSVYISGVWCCELECMVKKDLVSDNAIDVMVLGDKNIDSIVFISGKFQFWNWVAFFSAIHPVTLIFVILGTNYWFNTVSFSGHSLELSELSVILMHLQAGKCQCFVL